jgi:alanine racemase
LTLRLTVDTESWRTHVGRVAAAYSPLVPVVKGNGYGFGRPTLARIAEELVSTRRAGGSGQGRDDPGSGRCPEDIEPPTIAVGTIHELAGLPSRVRPLVLTPPVTPAEAALRAASGSAVVTVGDPAHVAALRGWKGSVLIKVASSMRRFGVLARQLEDFERSVRAAGFAAIGYSIHLPLAGEDADRVAEVERWLAMLDGRHGAPSALWVSHLGPDAYAGLRTRWPAWRFPMRIGTGLWHGDKSALQLGADVLDVRTVAAGSIAGYHGTRVISDGTLVVVGAGSAHGIATLDDGRSPFHFRRRRLALLERPHMHTSMMFVPSGLPCPAVGDTVDVQRPLISVAVDELIWQER